MKFILPAFFAIVALLCLPAAAQSYRHQNAVIQASVVTPTWTDWYVRKDGGNRVQCDGQADAAYVPTGPAGQQHCGLNDYRLLAYDGGYDLQGNWIIKGGDHVHIEAGQWRVGYNGPNATDHDGLANAGSPDQPAMPPVPSGTAANPTLIVGAGKTVTQVFGGYSTFATINLAGSAFVNVTDMEITSHQNCIRIGVPVAGSAVVPTYCSSSYPLDDYAQNGIVTSSTTHDTVLQNLYIHGFTSRGIIGSMGGLDTMTNVDISTNGGAGRDYDDGTTTAVNPVLNWKNVTIEFSGCNQAYPSGIVASCFSQSTGGYGDGVGTPNGMCLGGTVDHSTFRYNTQEGFDTLHTNLAGVTCPLIMTNNVFYGNNGQAIKWGAGNTPVIFTGNTVINSCQRLSAPLPATVALPNYYANLSDWCRAGDGVAFTFFNGGSVDFENNTYVGYAPTLFDVTCADQTSALVAGSTTSHTCAAAKWTFKNNIVLAYTNPAASGYNGDGGPGVFDLLDPSTGNSPFDGTVTRTNNLYFQVIAGHGFTPATTELVVSPQFVNQPAGNGTTFVEGQLDGFNTNLASGSPAIGMGAPGMIVGTASVVTTPPPPPPVVPVAPTITWTAPASIVSGTAISTVQLNATASVPGSFTYTPALGTVPAIGTDVLSVAFVPTDTTDFTNAKASVSLVVTQPVVAIPPPTPPPAPVVVPKAFSFSYSETTTKTITCTPTVSGSTIKWACK